MDKVVLNKQMGTKWFTFYTKVRPWFVCLDALSRVSGFIEYIDVYTSFWWMFLYFALPVVQAVLSVVVAIKSYEDYGKFVRFVKLALIVEVLSMAYQPALLAYVNGYGEIGMAFAIFVFVLTAGYFLWFELNARYFEKRRLYIESNDDDSATTISQGILKNEKAEAVTEPSGSSFCRKCGSRLAEGSLFCSKCGTKVVEEL